jgi:N-acetylmuramoyl-L-alanine amidase
VAGYYNVKQGDHLAKIAHDLGFRSSSTIWDHPENAALKNTRKVPGLLYPGDRLYVPDRDDRQENAPTDQKHVYVYHGETLKLKVRVRDVNGEPVANKPCQLEVEGRTYSLTTDAAGLVEQIIPRNSQSGRLTVSAGDALIESVIPLAIGYLDPVDEVSGQRGRLNNLGYRAGGEDDSEAPAFRSAVEEFQCDHALTPVTGVCDARTKAKLVEVHGS